MRTLLGCCCLAAIAAAARDPGLRPRAGSEDYPAHETAASAAVGAAILSPDQVKKLFATDLNSGGYLVFEVAIYPQAGKEIDVSSGDFLLRRLPAGETVRPAGAQAVAASLQRKNAPKPGTAGDISVYPTATIGYESGGYDPATGRRTRGVYTGAGVGVGIGEPRPPGPASTDRDRYTMQQELEDKGLPQGKTAQPVAGYLYFPKPLAKDKNAAYELAYYGADRQIKLRLAAPSR